MKGVREADLAPANIFPPVRVLGVMKTVDEYGSARILQLLNAVTGKAILEIGTSDVDDYYPGFVALFSPENL